MAFRGMYFTVSCVRMAVVPAGAVSMFSQGSEDGHGHTVGQQGPGPGSLPLGSSPYYSLPPTEAIVESALYKCVLKPLKEAINSCLHEIHSKDGSLQQLKENQLVILATTTTDLGVTTSVPEVPVMEKILQKFSSMHKAYSPEKKIAILLKTCKLIYDSMALGNPGRWPAGRRGLGWGSRGCDTAWVCDSSPAEASRASGRH